MLEPTGESASAVRAGERARKVNRLVSGGLGIGGGLGFGDGGSAGRGGEESG
jgi:hypothetical protein